MLFMHLFVPDTAVFVAMNPSDISPSHPSLPIALISIFYIRFFAMGDGEMPVVFFLSLFFCVFNEFFILFHRYRKNNNEATVSTQNFLQSHTVANLQQQ